MQDEKIEKLIDQLARLPGFGARSARRAALYLLKKRPEALLPLARSLDDLVDSVKTCVVCGNISTHHTCPICTDPKRDQKMICVVEQVSDLWAIERAGFFRGQYHVLGGALSAFDGIGPEELRIPYLKSRIVDGGMTEVVLALGATMDGQTTAFYIEEQFAAMDVQVTMLAKGVPLGSDLDYLDEGTIETAFRARRGG